jgi:transcriptional regulator with XRE-family HTH domain
MLGDQIKAERVRLSWTQHDLASRLSVTPQTVSDWEAGRKEPSTEKLIALANAFDVSLDALVGRQRGG